MMIELPRTRAYASLVAVGQRLLAPNVAQVIGSVVVKGGYLLTPTGGGADTHRMEPDPVAPTLVVADQGAMVAGGFDVTREADVAPFKPRSDIAVENFLSGLGLASAEVRVDGAVWLTRDAGSPVGLDAFFLADRDRHLFGYQPRSLGSRQVQAGTVAAPQPPRPIQLAEVQGFQNDFLNFHRRSHGFTATAAVSNPLVAGQRVVVRKAGSDVLSVTLTHPTLTALYRTWCGSGPDEPPYWSRVSIGGMHADTLILKPDAGKAEVIWRAFWPWAGAPTDSYRMVRLSEEAA